MDKGMCPQVDKTWTVLKSTRHACWAFADMSSLRNNRDTPITLMYDHKPCHQRLFSKREFCSTVHSVTACT